MRIECPSRLTATEPPARTPLARKRRGCPAFRARPLPHSAGDPTHPKGAVSLGLFANRLARRPVGVMMSGEEARSAPAGPRGERFRASRPSLLGASERPPGSGNAVPTPERHRAWGKRRTEIAERAYASQLAGRQNSAASAAVRYRVRVHPVHELRGGGGHAAGATSRCGRAERTRRIMSGPCPKGCPRALRRTAPAESGVEHRFRGRGTVRP